MEWRKWADDGRGLKTNLINYKRAVLQLFYSLSVKRIHSLQFSVRGYLVKMSRFLGICVDYHIFA